MSTYGTGSGGNASNGSAGGRGGDISSHNKSKDSYNTSNTSINYFYGPQYIVNPDGRTLDLTLSGNTITSNPFYGGSNQMWLLENVGGNKFILRSLYNGSFVKADGPNLLPSSTPSHFELAKEGGGYKIIAPDIGLALGLGNNDANLRPKTNKSTNLEVLEDNEENREKIKELTTTSNLPSIDPTPWTGPLRSVTGSNSKTYINFVNRMDVEARIHWVAYDSSCSNHGVVIQPGQVYRQLSYGRHVWVVVVNDRLQKYYTALDTECKVLLNFNLSLQPGVVYNIMYQFEHETLEEYGNRQIQCGLSGYNNSAKWILESFQGKWALKSFGSYRYLGINASGSNAAGTYLAAVDGPFFWNIIANESNATYR
ncbi:hypothetical protein D9757_001227 [Collybiopsis confluens]|uniref:Ricin B lectin domain-containing protein n=1 Tax=Collybiopsis confluens TaxID=2823264 RepID=A0A8H5MGF7_9AGAR|nr:hypothetical protein D9757_001227 [Collybiopsis confluens]